MENPRLRIVSLVPSWTETLLEAGAEVVGRTRFCIHPKTSVSTIAVVGGTKQFDLERVKRLKPDVILLDREENTKEMAELAKSLCGVHVSHVESVRGLPDELEKMAALFSAHKTETHVAENLRSMRNRFLVVLEAPKALLHNHSLPGLISWLVRPATKSTHLVYIIWKNPWMAISKETFIASVLSEIGFCTETLWPPSLQVKYPEFAASEVPETALLLFSSEPYPFEKKPPLDFGHRAQALVDGESFSWFGIRSLRFLESVKTPYKTSK